MKLFFIFFFSIFFPFIFSHDLSKGLQLNYTKHPARFIILGIMVQQNQMNDIPHI